MGRHIDATDVASCKDCIHYKPDLVYETVGYCDINGGAVHDEHFCSHFERCDGGDGNA